MRGREAASFVVSDFEQLSFENQFDAVVFFASLHHALDPQRAIDAAHRALKHGGMLLASEPGLGHAKLSAKTMETYDVTDRDMPPSQVIAYGRRAGFRSFHIHQHADQIASVLYSEPAGRLRRALFRFAPLRYGALLFSLLFYKRYNGITLMIK
jgi:SAM-dependent methyltransferase